MKKLIEILLFFIFSYYCFFKLYITFLRAELVPQKYHGFYRSFRKFWEFPIFIIYFNTPNRANSLDFAYLYQMYINLEK